MVRLNVLLLIAVLAAYRRAITAGEDVTLAEYLDQRVFADAAQVVVEPDVADVASYATFLERYEAGLAIERAAIAAV